MKSIADINAIREQMQSKVLIRDNTKEGETHVFVAMGTAGLQSGAVEVFNAFVDEISTRLIKNVRISRAGCLGRFLAVTAGRIEEMPAAIIFQDRIPVRERSQFSGSAIGSAEQSALFHDAHSHTGTQRDGDEQFGE